MFKALIILRISSSLKSKELTGRTLPFFKGVHCSAKNLLKTQAFVIIPVQPLLDFFLLQEIFNKSP